MPNTNERKLKLVFPFQKYIVEGTAQFPDGESIYKDYLFTHPDVRLEFGSSLEDKESIYEIIKYDETTRKFNGEIGFDNHLDLNTKYMAFIDIGGERTETRADSLFMKVEPTVTLKSNVISTPDEFELITTVSAPEKSEGVIDQPKIIGTLHFYDETGKEVLSEEITTNKTDGSTSAYVRTTKKFSETKELRLLKSVEVQANISGFLSEKKHIDRTGFEDRIIELTPSKNCGGYVHLNGGMFSPNTPISVDWGDGSKLDDYKNEGIDYNYKDQGTWDPTNRPVIKMHIQSKDVTLNHEAFKGNAFYEKIVLPEDIDIKTAFSLFEGQTNLVDVKLPNCAKIPMNAFTNCTSLGDVIIPDTVELLEAEVFKGANAKSLTLSNNLRRIDDSCFYNMTVPHLTIPESVKTIYLDAFQNDKNQTLIKDISFTWTDPSKIIDYNFFRGTYGDACKDGTKVLIPGDPADIKTAYETKHYPTCSAPQYYGRLSVTADREKLPPEVPEVHGASFVNNEQPYVHVELVQKSSTGEWIPLKGVDLDNVQVHITGDDGKSDRAYLQISVKDGVGHKQLDMLNAYKTLLLKIDSTQGDAVTQINEPYKFHDSLIYIEPREGISENWNYYGAKKEENYDINENNNGVITIDNRVKGSDASTGLLVGMGDIKYPHFKATAKVKFQGYRHLGNMLFGLRNKDGDMQSVIQGGVTVANDVNAVYGGEYPADNSACLVVSRYHETVFHQGENVHLQPNKWYDITVTYQRDTSTDDGNHICKITDENDNIILNRSYHGDLKRSTFDRVPEQLALMLTGPVDTVDIKEIVVDIVEKLPTEQYATFMNLSIPDVQDYYHIGDEIDVNVALKYYDNKHGKAGTPQPLKHAKLNFYQIKDKYGKIIEESPLKSLVTDDNGEFNGKIPLNYESPNFLGIKVTYTRDSNYENTYDVFYTEDSSVLSQSEIETIPDKHMRGTEDQIELVTKFPAGIFEVDTYPELYVDDKKVTTHFGKIEESSISSSTLFSLDPSYKDKSIHRGYVQIKKKDGTYAKSNRFTLYTQPVVEFESERVE